MTAAQSQESLSDPADDGSQTAPRALRGYQPGLDGMRAVLMFFMLAYHAEFPWARGGYLAVSQFFTLSGFLVMTVLLDGLDRSGTVNLRRFWTRRVRRLLPASLLALAGIVVFGATVATRLQAEALPAQIAAAAANVSNWLFIVEDTSYVNQFAAPSPVLHFWSLSVEEQFYLVLPLVLVVALKLTTSRVKLGALFAAGAIASAAWMAFLTARGASVDRVYYGTDTRLSEVLSGALLAVILSRIGVDWSHRWRQFAAWGGSVLYVVGLWAMANIALTEGPMWSGGILLFSLATCAAIVAILTRSGPLRVLEIGPLPAMGRITYGLYVYHFPIYLWLTAQRTGLSQWPLFGLRLAVTFAVAIASYHLVEMPIRNGATLGTRRRRLILAPLLAFSIVVAGFVVIDRGVDDPFATIRGEAAAAPGVASDPTLDVLVITDAAGVAVATGLEDAAVTESTLNVTRAPVLQCDALVPVGDAQTCEAWLEAWPKLIADSDPDAILFFVTDGIEADLRELAEPSADIEQLSIEVLSTGFDLLVVNDAPVVWTTFVNGFLDAAKTEDDPFRLAMAELLRSRADVLKARGVFVSQAETEETRVVTAVPLLESELRILRRRLDPSTRVMVVGDSQARSIAHGLQNYEATDGDALVWNLGSSGCGLLNEGEVIDLQSDERSTPDDVCREDQAAWQRGIDEFDPDIVIVWSSLRDVQDRRVDGWDDFRTIGDPAMDDYILQAYEDALDVFASRGATVVWMRAPCVRYVSTLGGGAEAPRTFDPQRIDRLNDIVLEQLADDNPDEVSLYPLDELLCPNGVFADDLGDLRFVRPDGIHLSLDAARLVGSILHRDLLEPSGG